ncbi:MAG: phosphohydrolase [Woeseiaceae bacterium]|nr:phosphohydrolase [Woeseiaceae bacterium]
MSEITILLLYLLAAVAFAVSRLPRFENVSRGVFVGAMGFALAGLLLHAQFLNAQINPESGLILSIESTLSLVGLQLSLIGALGAIEPRLRGMTAGLLTLAALATLPLGLQGEITQSMELTWQIQAHILTSIFSYGLLAAGAIIAVFALVQDRRLRSGRFSAVNHLFAPLETTEKLLFGVATAGFIGLLLSVVSGFTFVEDLFAQHLVHKTALSILALFLFGILVAGRIFAGWRGKRAVYLYLSGFAFLCLAYFGARFVLEEILGRSWG